MLEFSRIITYEGNDLDSLSRPFPLLLIFLRHFGCIFCREALSDIADRREMIEKNNIKVVFVHMTEPSIAEDFFDEYELEGVEHIPDPETRLYRSFELKKAKFSQLFGLKVWARGYQLTKKSEHNLSLKQIGDNLQMPGVFLIHNGMIVKSFIHNSVSDRPDYDNFINYQPS